MNKILGGEEQEPHTVFNIYGSTMEQRTRHRHRLDRFLLRSGKSDRSVRVPGHLELRLEPIKNPVTGKPHRAVIRLPEGFEYREAEMASGSFQGHKDWDFEHNNCYGAMWYAAYGPYGILEA